MPVLDQRRLGFTEEGGRVLLSVTLGMRESFEDWQELGRNLIARGLGAPMLIVADGAPGYAKLPERRARTGQAGALAGA